VYPRAEEVQADSREPLGTTAQDRFARTQRHGVGPGILEVKTTEVLGEILEALDDPTVDTDSGNDADDGRQLGEEALTYKNPEPTLVQLYSSIYQFYCYSAHEAPHRS